MKQQSFPIKIKFGLCIDYLSQKEAFIHKMIKETKLDLYTGRVYFLEIPHFLGTQIPFKCYGINIMHHT